MATSSLVVSAQRAGQNDVHLRGWMLLAARGLWLAMFVLDFALFLWNVLQPAFGGQSSFCPLTFTCPPTPQAELILRNLQITSDAYNTYLMVFSLVFALVFVGISTLLFWKKFDHPAGLFASFAFLFIGYNGLLGDPADLPLALRVIVEIMQANVQELCLGLFLVTFPDGRFVPRWSWLIGCTFFVQSLFFQLPNGWDLLNWPTPLVVLELILAYGSPIVVQVYRYARVSTLPQRQQTRWVIFGLVCALLLLFIAFFSGAFFPETSPYQLTGDPLSSLAFMLMPISVYIAIQRSRLWDIDRVINRVLVYGLLSIALALVYLVLVFGVQILLANLAGYSDNGIVIVGATLVVAACFQPFRRSIQSTIDRRFYRQKYDAVRTLQAFGATLRQDIDLEHLQEQLVGVVQKTVQPASISLWLFKPASGKTALPPDADAEKP